MNILKLSAAALVASVAFAGAAAARDQIQVAGSSTVLPYATIVAEAFGENFDFPSPVVEGGGSGETRSSITPNNIIFLVTVKIGCCYNWVSIIIQCVIKYATFCFVSE